ncbi:MAG TPA: transglycosylase SLT domain-containing protein [Bryobacteraceae bacterium]|nr:transglycosylase SLT domain-containing protein [Bryobacteraceae bacterium]
MIFLTIAGCSVPRSSGYRTFLAPAAAPRAETAVLVSSPPEVEAAYYAHEAPALVGASAGRAMAPSSAGALIDRAEACFQEGKRLFLAGQVDGAREEFDRAIATLLAGRTAGFGRPDLERKLTELAEAIHQYDVSGLGAGDLTGEPVFDGSPLDEIPEPTFPIDPKLRDLVAEQLKATVSQLPLELNDDVLRYINYFSSKRGRRTLLGGLTRAGRYRAMIRRIFDEEGIPQELIHLAQAESGFSPRAVSRKKASGMWQFVQWRGREYGLIQTKTTDDRLDPEKATRAAARHLHDLYRQFGDWYLAMAAYNCGPQCVSRAVERTGYADIWELRRRRAIPRETSNYIPIILAMAIMAKNPAQYGLDQVEPMPPLEFSTVTMDAATDVQLIADITEEPVAAIREMNPALLTTVAPAGYSIHVPPGSGPTVLSALQLIPAGRRTAWRLHRVAEGDTTSSIARQFRTTPGDIAKVNPPDSELCAPGSLLIVPAAPKPVRGAVARKAAPAKTPVAAKKAAPAKAPVASKKAAPASKTDLVASKRTAAARSTSVSR